MIRLQKVTCAGLCSFKEARTHACSGAGYVYPGQVRLSFLTDRFRDDAPFWQFVVWLRQAGLILAVSIPQMAGEVTDLNLYIGSGACILVLLAALALQILARPYPYSFQNTLEVLLILASILVVVLGLVYSFLLKSSLLIEAILLATLLGSLLGGLAYLVAKHCRGYAAPLQPGAPPAPAPRPTKAGRSSPQLGGHLSRITSRSSPPGSSVPSTSTSSGRFAGSTSSKEPNPASGRYSRANRFAGTSSSKEASPASSSASRANHGAELRREKTPGVPAPFKARGSNTGLNSGLRRDTAPKHEMRRDGSKGFQRSLQSIEL